MGALRTAIFILFLLSFFTGKSQHSVARQWNEVLLEAIRNDYARPTVHARNLFHISTAMFDSWAVYDENAKTYFLGKTNSGFFIDFNGVSEQADKQMAQEEAMSYACYRLLHHRFKSSPDYNSTTRLIDSLFSSLGFDPSYTSMDYVEGRPADLGNYLADQIIEFGLQDGSSEQYDYANLFYFPVNPPLNPRLPGSQGIIDPNSWQPLSFDFFIDQSGNQIPGATPSFLSPEWGRTSPFSLDGSNLDVYEKFDYDYWVYHDPGMPAMLDESDQDASQEYIWNHSMVVQWSAHLDPHDNVMWDISPGSIGNLPIDDFPVTINDLRSFYNEKDGSDFSSGRETNPITGQPYEEQIVPRGDYARVLAEFWADGPDSETPPGHWFTILNYVSDHPQIEKKFRGSGEPLSDLEWDVKSYFILAGAMHDAAIAAWGIKGYYDYVRPISAIRSMAERGQSSNANLENYDPWGIQLSEGTIEVVLEGDELAGANGEDIGKIKVRSWKGPDYIQDETVDAAGVGWILAENWWPYQRPTFVTPPFAGYISGHSTYSRAAAEVLTSLTGDEFFPGGMGEFIAKKNEFLVFEEGPSQDIILQWATYRDASDQCSLSRIWGGIHPPVDDIPGRLIGEKIGKRAFDFASQYFGILLGQKNETRNADPIYPNPIKRGQYLDIEQIVDFNAFTKYTIYTISGQKLIEGNIPASHEILFDNNRGIYLLKLWGNKMTSSHKIIVN